VKLGYRQDGGDGMCAIITTFFSRLSFWYYIGVICFGLLTTGSGGNNNLGWQANESAEYAMMRVNYEACELGSGVSTHMRK